MLFYILHYAKLHYTIVYYRDTTVHAPQWVSLHDKCPVFGFKIPMVAVQGRSPLLWGPLVRMDDFPITPQPLLLVQEGTNEQVVNR